MGLLDDAIREHLELKRRRGADPAEVARQEDEALGDPRSAEFVRPTEEPPDRAEPDDPRSEPGEPEPAGAVDPAPGERSAGPATDAPAAYAASSAPEPQDAWLEDEPVESREDAGSSAEPDVVDADEEPPREGDVLGETPDFLQETPEHDRLWFEQKPPRDFDFDR